MTLSISNEIPENVRRGLVAKGEGATWEECAEIAKISRYELQQWRSHPDADNLNLRFTDLHKWVISLEDFDDNPNSSNEKILESIQMAWIDERE